MENNKKVAICTKCRYFNNFDHGCKHTEAPYTEFIHGKKSCRDINVDGKCKLYDDMQSAVGSITVDLTLNTEPFKKKLAELLAGM